MTLYLQMTLYQQMTRIKMTLIMTHYLQMTLYQQMTRISRRIKTYLKGFTGKMDFIKKGN